MQIRNTSNGDKGDSSPKTHHLLTLKLVPIDIHSMEKKKPMGSINCLITDILFKKIFCVLEQFEGEKDNRIFFFLAELSV